MTEEIQAQDHSPPAIESDGTQSPILWKNILPVAIVALLMILLFRLGGVFLAFASVLVFADAWQAGIHKITGKSSFLNISAAGWAIACILMFVVAYPIYAFARNRLKTKPGNTALFVAVNVVGVLLLLLSLLPILAFFAGVKAA